MEINFKSNSFPERNLTTMATINNIIKSFNGNDDKCQSLYHYTTVKVMDSIVEKAEFWASNIYYLNDSKEYYAGIEYLKQIFRNSKYARIYDIIDEIKNENGHSSEGVFSISFSNQKDNLHQWLTYARESGVCIELDYKILSEQKFFLLNELEDNTYKHYSYCNSIISKALYVHNKNKITDKRSDILHGFAKALKVKDGELNIETISSDEELTNNFFNNKELAKIFFRMFASYCKNDAFIEESEYRIALSPVFGKEVTLNPKINYFNRTDGVIRPYIKVQMLPDGKTEPLLPIKSITVGPSGKQQAVFDSLVHRLRYGKKRIWNYYKESNCYFNEQFENYIVGAIVGYLDNSNDYINKDDIEYFSDKLVNNWKKDNNIDRINIDIDKISYNLSINSRCKNGNKKSENEKNTIITSIMNNNYLTKEGVWIRKSNIPYIY